jgi:hypothetical protein
VGLGGVAFDCPKISEKRGDGGGGSKSNTLGR